MAVLFEVPAEFRVGHAIGSVIRHGAILKDASTGRIVAHMQETGLLSKYVGSPIASIFSNAVTGINPATAAVDVASSLLGNYQAYRIEKRIDALEVLMRGIEALQYADIAMTGVGIGISVASFLTTRQQISAVSMKIDSLAETIERKFEEQKRRELLNLEGDLEAQLDHAEEGWIGDGTARWARVANKLNDMVYRYPILIEEELRSASPDPVVLSYLLERYRVLAATRVECLILIGELRPAQDFAARFAQKTNSLLNDVTPTGLARKIEASRRRAGGGHLGLSGMSVIEETRPLVAVMREFQDVSETRPLLIETLIERNVNGREYIETLREKRDSAVVLLT